MNEREPMRDGGGHELEVTNERGKVPEPAFKSRPAPFNAVCRALKGEREYQQGRWTNDESMKDREGPDDRTMEEFVSYARDELSKAEAALYDEDQGKALQHVRKFTALGVATMEVHGAPRRSGY